MRAVTERWDGLSYPPYPILGSRVRMEEAIADFRSWAAAEPGRMSEERWESNYGFWPPLTAVFCKFVDVSDPRAWDGPLVEQLLYILARDEEQRVLQQELAARPAHLAVLAGAGVATAEAEARWQLAAALGKAEIHEGVAIGLLKAYAVDSHQYVRRLALLALADRRAPDTEALARRAWMLGDDWERITALHVLDMVSSPLLPSYLAVAVREGPHLLREQAHKIADRQDTSEAPSVA